MRLIGFKNALTFNAAWRSFFIMAVSYMWIISWLSDGKSFVHELDISVDSRGRWKTAKLSTE